jgi:integrase
VSVVPDAGQGGIPPGRVVVEVGCGIVVYPPEGAGMPWRAVFTENGRRRYRQAVTEAELAAKVERVKERLAAGAPNMERPGADLIAHFLDPDRLPARQRWSRRHADTQGRLCRRFAVPVIAAVTCQDITPGHMQQIVNAAPTASEGDRLHRCLSALVSAGIDGGYLTRPQLARVHWQAGGRPLPDPQATTAGESPLWVDPAEIPAPADIAALGRALALGQRGDLDELMANAAAYSGLRQGELFALAIPQLDTPARVITVNRKLIEVAGKQYIEAPKNRKNRKTIYPARTPHGYPLADRLAARAGQARAEQAAGLNPHGLIFPSPRNKLWRSSNFDRRVLAPAYHAAGWRDPQGHGTWTWHSLRHAFCTTALFTWKLDPTDVSRMAGHANYRITLDMYVGTTAGILDRARQATQ